MSYSELSVEERATIQIGQAQGFSQRGIARLINRSPSTISRELRRNRDAGGGYSARSAQQRMRDRRQVCRPQRKLLPGSERFELVTHMLRERLSPEQIAGKLRSMNIPSLRDAYVCRETIYNAIYALPVGELRKELSSACVKVRRHAGLALAALIGAGRSRRWLAFMCARRRSRTA